MSTTGIYILLDRSQSMGSQWGEALGAVNAYVEALEDKSAKILFACFDSLGYDVLRNTSVGEFKAVSPTELQPRGGTPLLDAAARIMYRVLDDNFDKSVLLIMTDGEENSSRKYSLSEVKHLTGELERRKWQVLFLGANFDKIGAQATSFGVAAGKFMNMTVDNYQGSMRGLASNTSFYTSGAAASIDFSDDDKQAAVKK